MTKQLIGHQLTRNLTTRWSEYDHKRLVQRALRAGAKTLSAYIRSAALASIEFELQSFEEKREFRNALIRLAMALEALPPTKEVDETLAKTKATLSRICRL